MTITGLDTAKFEIGDEVLYLDPNDRDKPYQNGVVKQVIKIDGGPDRLSVLLDDGQYVYNNCTKFMKVYKMHTCVIKSSRFKIGDLVWWKDKKATITDTNDRGYYTIRLDKPLHGYSCFTVHEETIKMYAADPKPEKEYTVKCAEWFKTAYAAITKAGGCPDLIIEQIPPDLLETLIRNDIKLYYKK